jgi:N utilization substance protein B
MKRRDIRKLAMQLLYQIDLSGGADREALLQMLGEWDHAPASPEQREAAVDLALGAWRNREAADGHIAELAPDWPSHRQPPVDRAILRLGYHEMTTGHAPSSVAINEAVELAKRYCGEHSPSFINGVLDKLAKRIELPTPHREEAGTDPDRWLRDALEEES